MDADPNRMGSGPPSTALMAAAAERRRWPWVLLAVAVSLLILAEAAVGGLAWSRIHSGQGSRAATQRQLSTVPQVTSPNSSATGGNVATAPAQNGGTLDVQSVASKVEPAVVDITTVVAGLNQNGQAAGTGIVLTTTGEVLTNNHVVQGSTSIQVTFPATGVSHAARVIGVDTSADVALIQVEGVSGLRTATLADTSGLKVGQPVVAIGNALGRGGAPSVTQGAITALDQSITAGDASGSEQLSGLIESDAPISPGDSGGPLANSAGQVIGMITAGQTSRRRQTTSTVGYAIPASAAVDAANRILSGSTRPGVILGLPGYLGVSVRNLDAAAAAQLGLGSTSSGVLVIGVQSGSPAAQIGLAQNVVITAIDGTSVGSAAALGPAIQAHKPGERIQVTWVDSAGSHTATVSLASGPAA